MSERPPGEPSGLHDPTRDIRLPALPDRPPPALPREWAGAAPAAPSPMPPLPASGGTDAPHAPARRLESQRTDKLSRPPVQPRERTLAFSHPDMGRRPVGPVTVRPSRRWPWIVLALLPVLVIAGAAVAWLLLLRSA